MTFTDGLVALKAAKGILVKPYPADRLTAYASAVCKVLTTPALGIDCKLLAPGTPKEKINDTELICSVVTQQT